MRGFNRRRAFNESVLTLGQFIKKYIYFPTYRNFGDVSYVDYGGDQIKSSLDGDFEIYHLYTPDSGLDGWGLEYANIHLNEIISNFKLDMQISLIEFSDERNIQGIISFVGANSMIEKFKINPDPDTLYEIITNIITGVCAYGGYGEQTNYWKVEDIYDEEELDSVRFEVENDLKRLKLDL